MLLSGRVPYSTNPPNKERLKAMIAKNDPDWTKPYIQDLSQPCQAFLKRCFTREVSKRPNAGDLLEDPWIKSNNEIRASQSSQMDLREQTMHMKEIFEFSQYNKITKLTTSLLLGLRQDAEDVSILKELFHKIDTNNDGTISIDEFVKASDELQDEQFFTFNQDFQEVFKKIDLDGDGRIDFHEFCAASVNHKKLLSTENLKLVFETLDISKSGTIEIEEFKRALPSNFKRGKQYMETSRESAYRKAKANL